MIINKNKLKNKIIDKGYTVKGFCEIVGIEISSYYRRLKNEVSFNLNEINKIIDILALSSADVKEIFFNRTIEEVQENNTSEEDTQNKNINTDINEIKTTEETEEEQEKRSIKDYTYIELIQADFIQKNITIYEALKELERTRLEDIQDGYTTIDNVEQIKIVLADTIKFNNEQIKKLSKV